jgi:hypothetical protein
MPTPSSLGSRLTIIVGMVCLFFGIISWIVIASQTSQLSRQALNDKGHSTLNQLAEMIRAPLLNNDVVSIQFVLRSATEDDLIFSASLYDVENELIAMSSQEDLLIEKPEIFRETIEVEETVAGTLVVSLNSQPIHLAYSQVFYLWSIVWALFTFGCTYACYKFASRLSTRLNILANRLPGKNDIRIDEITMLERKIQPLLSSSRQSEDLVEGDYYCSMITTKFKNRDILEKQLNQENLELLWENIDLCTERTLELYGAQRSEGDLGMICFNINSTHNSKQHILVCLMAIYSLQQLLIRLSEKLGIDLEIACTLTSENIRALPVFGYHESLARLKDNSQELSEMAQRNTIIVSINEYSIDQLSSIARFRPFEGNRYIFEGFPEQRQMLLEKQIVHLASICL